MNMLEYDQVNMNCLNLTLLPISPLSSLTESSHGNTISELIQIYNGMYLPINTDDHMGIVVHQKHVLKDTLHQLRCGLDTSKYILVTFVGEAAVDSGGPM
uniref:HECT domain-containing protein n=1 Tax=Amphimedon queenslandica TaxID=400682 RepID=A0A1X7THP0_AMPQE